MNYLILVTVFPNNYIKPKTRNETEKRDFTQV